MVLRNGWATVTEIKAASQMLRKKIKVWLVGNGSQFTSIFSPACILSEFGNEFGNKNAVNVLLDQQHFQLLQPLFSDKSPCDDKSFGGTESPTTVKNETQAQGPSTSNFNQSESQVNPPLVKSIKRNSEHLVSTKSKKRKLENKETPSPEEKTIHIHQENCKSTPDQSNKPTPCTQNPTLVDI